MTSCWSPQVDPWLCVRARGGNGPSACVRLCPTNALDIRKQDDELPGPVIDKSRCIGCGLCAAVCMTPALECRDGEGLLSEITKGLENAPVIRIGCSRSSTIDQSHLETMVIVPCLGALSEAVLVHAVINGANCVVLDDRFCAGCRQHRGRALARRTVGRVRRLLLASDLPPVVVFESRIKPSDTDVRGYRRQKLTFNRGFTNPQPIDHLSHRSPRKVHRHPSPDPSRRRFFSTLYTLTIGRPVGSPPTRSGRPRPRRDREILEATFNAVDQRTTTAKVSRGGTSLHALGVSAACNMCGACVALCPTAALKITDSVDGATLSVRPIQCTGCGLCIGRCPVRALQILPEFPSSWLHRTDLVALAHAVRIVCPSCRKPRLDGNECPDCKFDRTLAVFFGGRG